MQVGGIEMYLGHGVLYVGSTAEVDLAIFDEDGPVSATASHVRIAARAQDRPVRVRLWRGVAPRVGKAVFDGVLKLPDGKLAVVEAAGQSRFVTRVGLWAPRVIVAVDDPGNASRVDIVVEPEYVPKGTQRWAAGQPPFPALTVAPGGKRHTVDALADALTGYDFPVQRLGTALTLIQQHARQGTGALDARFYVGMVVEWLRWLHDGLTYEMCQDAGELISDQLAQRRADAGLVLAYLERRLGGPVIEDSGAAVNRGPLYREKR